MLDKLRVHPDSNVFGDLEWFARHKMAYIENCDANFGIIKRDIEYAKRMVSLKQSTGYPGRFRAAFAKNSNETIWEIANLLHDAGMLKAVTLAMQSMNDQVLTNIQRKNIKFDAFGSLIKRYEAAGIPTYTELILGLAGETYDMFVDGIETLLFAGQHSGIFCYMNMMLPNTEQAHPEYIKRHGLRTVNMQAMLLHGTPESGVVRERQETIVETAAMPHNDWKRAWLFARVVECFHCLGLLQHVAIVAHDKQSIPYKNFYAGLIWWLEKNPDTVAGREFANMRTLLDMALAGGSWDCIDERFGTVSWPPEEYAFLRILAEKDKFYGEMEDFCGGSWTLGAQREMISGPSPGNEVEWAKTALWYGRKGSGVKLKKVTT